MVGSVEFWPVRLYWEDGTHPYHDAAEELATFWSYPQAVYRFEHATWSRLLNRPKKFSLSNLVWTEMLVKVGAGRKRLRLYPGVVKCYDMTLCSVLADFDPDDTGGRMFSELNMFEDLKPHDVRLTLFSR